MQIMTNINLVEIMQSTLAPENKKAQFSGMESPRDRLKLKSCRNMCPTTTHITSYSLSLTIYRYVVLGALHFHKYWHWGNHNHISVHEEYCMFHRICPSFILSHFGMDSIDG